ncbi:unnamed protein product [Rotaria sp. Silwood1]|nr:unnamed protein product [Rotaria sp. Silwood1]CAF3691504.1 unnamed protein product [Rotaria sp. Silwood1]CAF3694887.1 unnamed protein product [Rotaria sp. Silwood1]CAF4721836.1 unnamed protein product [Rotaria sp. Silwood1]CAF4949574.1 unnamed protein product [Rotaria sp. Silwood1]
MVGRNYNAQRIYQQIAPLIENPFRNGSIQCYDEKNQIGLCSSNQVCAFIFDQKGNKVKSRGCALNTQGKVSVYDGDSYTQFDIECNRPLCNTDETFQQIKTILIEHRLIDVNGRRIAAGTKQMISYLLMISTLIFIVVYYL